MCAEPSAFIRAEPMRIDGINASLPTGYNKKKWKQHISVNKRRKNWNTTQHVLPQFHPFHHLVSMTHASLLAEDDVYFWTSNIVEFANNWIMNNSLAPNARTQQYLVAAMPLALLDLSTWNTCGWPLDTFNGCEAVIMSITYSSRALTHRSIDAQTKQHQYEHTQRVTRTRVYSANDAPHVGWPRIQRIYSHTLIETKKNKHHLRLFNSIFDHCFHFCFFIPTFFFYGCENETIMIRQDELWVIYISDHTIFTVWICKACFSFDRRVWRRVMWRAATVTNEGVNRNYNNIKYSQC